MGAATGRFCVWVLGFLSWVSYGLATVSFTNKNIPANPANSTAVSYPTDT